MINQNIIENEQAYKLKDMIMRSKIINKLNSLPGMYRWEYSTKYDFFENTMKLYGDNFYSRRIIEIKFNAANLDTSINFYREVKTVDGVELKPIDVDFYVFQVVSKFLDHVIKVYRLFNKKESYMKERKLSPCVQQAIDIFGSDLVSVVN